MSYIPRKTKVRMEFYKGIGVVDILYLAIGVGVLLLIAFSNGINAELKVALCMSWIGVIFALFMPIADGKRLFATLWILFRFLAEQKKYSKHPKRKHKPITEMMPYSDIANNLIDYKEYYAGVIEIRPIAFYLLNEEKQNMIVRTFSNALRALSVGQHASIVKVQQPMVLDSYRMAEDRKYDEVTDLVSEHEMKKAEAEARNKIFESRMQHLRSFEGMERIYMDHFYVVVYDIDREGISATIDTMIDQLQRGVVPMTAHRLNDQQLAVFLKAQYTKEFNEAELATYSMDEYLDWVTPETVVFKPSKTIIDGMEYRNFAISDYPINVPNAWAMNFFLQPGTKVVMNLTPLSKEKAESQIDRSIIELEGRMSSVFKSSKQIDLQSQHETLSKLLSDLKLGNEDLYDVNVHICCEASQKKEIRTILKQSGFKYSEMFGRQKAAFIAQNISRKDEVKDLKRNIQTSGVAASFPFISDVLQDPDGVYLGKNRYPVFIDFFQRNNERVNSNMIVIGKSGSGKSYATKTLLANLAADNSRIFILDPEHEYEDLARNLEGKQIDVGSSINGIMNPFHVYTTLSADEGEGGDSFSMHLQFLEEFFHVIFDGMDGDAFEILNSVVLDAYFKKGINSSTDLSKLKPEDYPIFDDVYNLIGERLQNQTDTYLARNLQILHTYVQKFASGGRNSNLWNGPTSIQTEENFVCFNFQSLMANRNMTIANAQMLLVFKYLDNEISKNKDFNTKYNTRRQIIVAVDEAHLFINPKFPIALDFMAQMAKRIRKYEGMQIVITQNVKDFIGGSAETQRQATAVINASQYSMIFSLAPNDMTDLVELYRNAGGINQDEQDTIVTAGRGECFFIASPYSRTTFLIEANDSIKQIANLGKR